MASGLGPSAYVAGMAFIPGCSGTSKAAWAEVEGRAAEHPSFSSAPRGKPTLPAAPHRGEGVGVV